MSIAMPAAMTVAAPTATEEPRVTVESPVTEKPPAARTGQLDLRFT